MDNYENSHIFLQWDPESTFKKYAYTTAIVPSKQFSSQNVRPALKSRSDGKRSNINLNQYTILVIKILCITILQEIWRPISSQNAFPLDEMYFIIADRHITLVFNR